MKNTNWRRLANLWWLPLFVVGWGGFTFGGWPKWIYATGMGGLAIYLMINIAWQERRHRRLRDEHGTDLSEAMREQWKK